MTVLYITPTGSGSRDGTSWENAGTLGSLDSFIGAVGPGGEVLLRADAGAYAIGSIDPKTIRHGGASGAPVTVRGVDELGAAMKADFVGVRADPWLPGLNKGGQEVFRLLSGADHLVFKDLAFKNVGSGGFRIGADIADLTLRDITADNVQSFLKEEAVASGGTASVDGLTIRNVEVHGFSKSVIHLLYDSRHILIEDVLGDSEGQDGDNFAMGVHLEGTVHDVVVRATTMLNSHNSVNSYWNGDGFATERGVYDVLFENTYAGGNTDGGYDLKSSGTRLVSAVAEDNKRNFRLWSDDIVIQDSVSLNPHIRGGIGLQSHIWVAAGAHPSVIRATLSDNDARTVVLDVSDGADAVLSLAESTIQRAAGSTLVRMAVGSRLILDGVAYGTDANGALVGTEAKDSLVGSAGPDELNGAGGDDLINGRDGADVIVGGAGSDRVAYDNSPEGVTVDLVAGIGAGSHAEGDRLSGIENVRGSPADDNLYGDGGANVITGEQGDDTIEGRAGADILVGGAGIDTLIYSDSQSSIAVNLADGTGSRGDASGDRVSQFENLVGSRYADELVGNGGDNVILGSGGVETAETDNSHDLIHGGAGHDELYGKGGDDILFGDAGDDWLDGGKGDDYLHGGTGNDVARYNLGQSWEFTFAWNADGSAKITDNFGDYGTDTVVDIEQFSFENGTFIFSQLMPPPPLPVNGSDGGRFRGGNGYDLIQGNEADNTLSGAGGNDRLVGGDGNERLFGGSGYDKLYGQKGRDVLHGDTGNDRVFGGPGDDKLFGDDGNDLLAGDVGMDELYGGAGSDIFVYNSPSDSIADHRDTIFDFEAGTDKIDLKQVFVSAGASFAFLGFDSSSETELAAGQVEYRFEAIGGEWLTLVEAGIGVSSGMSMQITLAGRIMLSAADFIV